jgi:hypothetical protein
MPFELVRGCVGPVGDRQDAQSAPAARQDSVHARVDAHEVLIVEQKPLLGDEHMHVEYLEVMDLQLANRGEELGDALRSTASLQRRDALRLSVVVGP